MARRPTTRLRAPSPVVKKDLATAKWRRAGTRRAQPPLLSHRSLQLDAHHRTRPHRAPHQVARAATCRTQPPPSSRRSLTHTTAPAEEDADADEDEDADADEDADDEAGTPAAEIAAAVTAERPGTPMLPCGGWSEA
eukprot:scaffold152957_cov35-Tisochrysis_lutea.AAC.2